MEHITENTTSKTVEMAVLMADALTKLPEGKRETVMAHLLGTVQGVALAQEIQDGKSA